MLGNSAGPRMLPAGLKLELYPMGPGGCMRGVWATSTPYPVVRASVRTPYLPKLLAGLPVPPGLGVRGDAGGGWFHWAGELWICRPLHLQRGERV